MLKKTDETEIANDLVRWLPLVNKPRSGLLINRWYRAPDEWVIVESNQVILKGLIWCCSLLPGREVTRALTATALSCYKKVPDVGPRLPGLGNACVYALGQIATLEAMG